MKNTADALRQLAEPDTGTCTYEMTPELRERWSRVTCELTDFLKARTEGPVEAYACLQFAMHAFEEAFGIRGGIIMENDDEKH